MRPPVEPRERHARAAELIELGRRFYARGWLPATSGNLSSRLRAPPGEAMAITASGRDKGALTEEDFLVADLQGEPLGDQAGRPSAEAALHAQLYAHSSAIGTVLHVHSPCATVLSLVDEAAGQVRLARYEMLKAFAGVTTHEHEERVPIFPNTQDIGRLAREVSLAMNERSGIHGYLIAGHGLYTWGADAAEAGRHVEAFEFLFDCVLRDRSVR